MANNGTSGSRVPAGGGGNRRTPAPGGLAGALPTNFKQTFGATAGCPNAGGGGVPAGGGGNRRTPAPGGLAGGVPTNYGSSTNLK